MALAQEEKGIEIINNVEVCPVICEMDSDYEVKMKTNGVNDNGLCT